MAYQHTLLRAAVLVSYNALWAWIPPHPNSKIQWESVHDMRRRLNLHPFNYTTSKFVDAEMCRYLTEDECAESDKMMQEHIKAHKTLQSQIRQNPNLGTINVLVLMIRFSDHTNRELVTKDDVDAFWQTKVPAWLDVNSQGRYSAKATVIDWVTTDNTEEYYSFGKRGTVIEAQQMAWPALNQLDNRPDWDWSQYDLDGNGQIDSLVIIHSGYGAETTTTDCFGADFNNRIWAHAFSAGRRNTWKSKDGSVRVTGYTMASALDGDCDAVPAKIGLTVHEYMHTLGLVDLYDGVDPLAASGIGAFDVMAYPYGQSGDANFPGHLSIYSKVLAEWAEPKEISASGIFDLKASEISDEAYRITLADFGITAEYLLIENRQPLEFDINIWSEGLIIYHIDDAADLQKNRGYPGQPGWPENGNHYECALLPKDGNYDLEKGTNVGDAGDFWLPGDRLGPGMGGTVFPNTDLYGLGFVQESGIWLEVLSQQGTDVTFQVGGFDGEAEPAATTPSPTPQPSAIAADETKGPTQAPSKLFTTVAPSMTENTPTATTVVYTPTIRPTNIPFGHQEEVTRTPTGPSYLSNFGAFGSLSTRRPTPQPTTIPPSASYLSTFGGSTSNPATPYLSNFGGSSEARAPTAFLSTFESVSSPPNPSTDSYLDSFGSSSSGSYLNSFESSSSVQLGPPQEGDKADRTVKVILEGKVFLSSAFRGYKGGEGTVSNKSASASQHPLLQFFLACGVCVGLL